MVTTDNLRLRTPPYAGNKIITVMDKGTRVKIIEIEEKEETIDGITSNWVMVEVQDGVFFCNRKSKIFATKFQ